jgi:hypothetical protein
MRRRSLASTGRRSLSTTGPALLRTPDGCTARSPGPGCRTGSGSRSRPTRFPRSSRSSGGSASQGHSTASGSMPARRVKSNGPSSVAGGLTRSALPGRTSRSVILTSCWRGGSTSTSMRSARSSGTAGAHRGRQSAFASTPERVPATTSIFTTAGIARPSSGSGSNGSATRSRPRATTS